MKLLNSIFISILFSLLIACGEETPSKKTNNTTQAQSVEGTSTAPDHSATNVSDNSQKGITDQSPTKGMLITFSVKDFDTWDEGFKSKKMSSIFLAYLSELENEKKILLIKPSHDHIEARKKADNPKIQNRFLKLGANHPITIKHLDIHESNKPSTKFNNWILITHEVSDFEKWKTVFDNDKPKREAEGISDLYIASDALNPNLVTVVLATNNLENAKEVFQRASTEETLQDAGVLFKPKISYWISQSE